MTLTLHYFPTLNAHKVTIALEEMALPYEIAVVDIAAGDQHSEEYRAINPNSRIPALVDDEDPAGPVAVFESAAILQYLGRKSGLLYPADEPARARIDSWLFWQMSALGPMSGQVNYYNRLTAKHGAEAFAYPLSRYRRETERLFGVLEEGLGSADFLVGDYSIADICAFTWVNQFPDNGGGFAPYPALSAWHGRIAARPAVQRGLAVRTDLFQQFVERRKDKAKS